MAIKLNKYIKVGKFFTRFVWILFVVASLNSVNKQIGVFLRARQENMALEREIRELETNNIILEQNIRYVTSVDYLRSVARDEFGLGGTNDYWIIAPEMEFVKEATIEEKEAEGNWRQWLELFTN